MTPGYFMDRRTNRKLATIIVGIVGAGNLLQSGGTNIFTIIPFGDTVVPLLNSIGLLWVAYGIMKDRI